MKQEAVGTGPGAPRMPSRRDVLLRGSNAAWITCPGKRARKLVIASPTAVG